MAEKNQKTLQAKVEIIGKIVLKSGQFLEDYVVELGLEDRPVDNVVAIYLKPKEAYRVQIGCFKNEQFANNFLFKIRSIGTEYRKAYLRREGKNYKIYIGPYGTKLEAIQIVNDLRRFNYFPFITSI